MIADKLSSLEKYKSVIPFYGEIADFLKKNDLWTMENGKYEINGDNVYVSVQEYETQKETEKKWESHKKYMDIQIVIQGTECIGHSLIDNLKVAGPYQEEKDVLFYQDSSKMHTTIVLKDDDFCVFYCDDGHKPGYYLDRPGKVKKAVIKVRVN